MRVKESLKKGFSVASQSMEVVAGLFVFGLIFSLINVFFTAKLQKTTTPSVRVSIVAVVVGVLFLLASIFVQAGLLGYVRDKIKSGHAGFSNFLDAGRKYYGSLLLLGLLVGAVVGVFILLAALAIFALGQKLMPVGIGIAVVLVAIGVYISLLMFLAPYDLVAGDQKVIDAVKHSIAMVRKNIMAVLGLSLILILIGFAAGIVLGLGLGILTIAVKGMAAQAIFAFFSSAVNAFLGLFVAGSFMTFYFGVANSNSNTAA